MKVKHILLIIIYLCSLYLGYLFIIREHKDVNPFSILCFISLCISVFGTCFIIFTIVNNENIKKYINKILNIKVI